jgi:plastocyanin domain-containing protein
MVVAICRQPFRKERIMKLFSRILSTAGLAAAAALGTGIPSTTALAQPAELKEVDITVQGSYRPGRIEVTEGQRVRLKFTRKESGPCTREVVFPALGIKKELPQDQVVVIELPALKAGEFEFKCGMNMIKGTIVVKPRT